MAFKLSRRAIGTVLLLCIVFISQVYASKGASDVTPMSSEEIEDALQECAVVQKLNLQKRAGHHETGSFMTRMFDVLFPGSPAVNSLLATAYISGPPNFLLALCPPNIDPASLSVMVAFAVGGLLGDTLFHLLPEIFLGEDEPDRVRFVQVEGNKNLLLGVAIMVGFLTFVAMDKGLRIATGGEAGHDHSHGHSSIDKKSEDETSSDLDSVKIPEGAENCLAGLSFVLTGVLKGLTREEAQALIKRYGGKVVSAPAKKTSFAVLGADPGPKKLAIIRENKTKTIDEHGLYELIRGREVVIADKDLRLRKTDKTEPVSPSVPEPASDGPSTSVKLSAYLNLIADFTHNITDGLALSSSFYASPALGATTTAAVFFHEIPHEVGDFALLIQGGFSKSRAMGAQFVTAVGAFLGTLLGIAIQEFGGNGDAAGAAADTKGGLAGTGLTWGDMLLPFTAGTFMYVGTVGVFPELLETGPNRREETWKTLKQFVAMMAGAGIMLA